MARPRCLLGSSGTVNELGLLLDQRLPVVRIKPCSRIVTGPRCKGNYVIYGGRSIISRVASLFLCAAVWGRTSVCWVDNRNKLRCLAFPPVQRYYFDIREDDQLAPDEEGLEMRNTDDVQKEAVQALADMARDLVLQRKLHHLAIIVRDETGPVLELNYNWSMRLISG